jgi:hypothetical protein
VSFILRELWAHEVAGACPDGRCPADRREEILTLRDRADILLPLGVGLAALGAATSGVAAWLLLREERPRVGILPRGPGVLVFGAF